MASQLAALEKRLNEGLLTRAKATPDVLDKRVSAVEATLAASSERIVGSSAAGGGGGAAGEGALRQRLADVERGQKQLSGEVEGLKLSGSDWRDTSGRLEKAIHALGSKAALLNETQSAKGLELERRLAGVERHRHELEESIVSMQAAQDAMLEEMTTMQAAAGGQGSRHSAPSRPTTANPDENLLRATQRELRALAEDYNGFRARMESNFDTAIMFIKGDLEQLEGRIAAVEATRELVLVELRQLENHVLARLGFVGDDVEAVRRTVNDVVGDLSVLASKVIAPSRQAGDPGDNTSGMVPPGALADLEVQLQAHLDALFQGMLSVTEAKFASAESLKHATDKCRANDDVILKALKEVDRRLHERVGSHDELFLRMARQVDIVQRYLQQKDSEFDAAHVPRLTISTGSNGTALQSSSLGAAMTALTSAQHKMGSRQGSVDPVQTQHGGQLPSLQGGHSQRQLLREHSSVDGMDPRQMQQVVGGYSMGPLGRERSSDGMSPRLQMPQVAEHGAGQAQMGPVGQLGQRQPIHSQVSRQRSVSEQGRHDPRFRNVRMEGV
ncbi:hypothetical protein FOA52_014407 [Chlamydomonas sp. UWO 241]|nr:hypothetical protein FOA52_014407 [Chlamydomonas sp. UWO 241]